MVSSFNLAEFYCKSCQRFGKQTADTWYLQVGESEPDLIHREDLVRLGGLEKCRDSSALSLADCFASALAKSEAALLITTDVEHGTGLA